MRLDTSKIAQTPNGGDSAVPEAAGPTCTLPERLRPTFDRLFEGLPHVVIAVSGGSDSMALLHLLVGWRRRRVEAGIAAPSISVVTVDHRLRPQSAAEAAAVASACTLLGIPHTTLYWDGPKPLHGIQNAARNARYALIRQHLATFSVTAVATAHTLEDQAETILMRLARGSGVDGLASMRDDTELDEDLRLLRPLLGVPKSALSGWLLQQGCSWSDDPSNASEKFERVRLRQALAAMRGRGFELDATALARSARRAARASDALQVLTAQTWAAAGEFASFDRRLGCASIDWEWLLRQPEEIRLRLLTGLLEAIGGNAQPVSLGQLERMTVGAAWQRPGGVTVHGTAWDLQASGRVRICREWGRVSATQIPVRALRISWDRRFDIRMGRHAGELTVGPLGRDGLAELAAAGCRPQGSARVLWTQPAIRCDGRVIAAPSLGASLQKATMVCQCETVLPRFVTRARRDLVATGPSETKRNEI